MYRTLALLQSILAVDLNIDSIALYFSPVDESILPSQCMSASRKALHHLECADQADRKAEDRRQRMAQKLIDEEEAAKKKAARQVEARAKKKAKKAKQRGIKQPKANAKAASSDSEQV